MIFNVSYMVKTSNSFENPGLGIIEEPIHADDVRDAPLTRETDAGTLFSDFYVTDSLNGLGLYIVCTRERILCTLLFPSYESFCCLPEKYLKQIGLVEITRAEIENIISGEKNKFLALNSPLGSEAQNKKLVKEIPDAFWLKGVSIFIYCVERRGVIVTLEYSQEDAETKKKKFLRYYARVDDYIKIFLEKILWDEKLAETWIQNIEYILKEFKEGGTKISENLIKKYGFMKALCAYCAIDESILSMIYRSEDERFKDIKILVAEIWKINWIDV